MEDIFKTLGEILRPEKMEIKTITKKQYQNTHKDFRGIYTSDNINGTNYNGKKTILHYDNGTCLLIEGISFKIVDTEIENNNPIRKTVKV